jgi:O-succinylbenzoic acid--CoA ligase
VLALMPFAAEDDWLLSLPLFHVSGRGLCGAGCWPARG